MSLSKDLQSCETKDYIQKGKKTDSSNYRPISLLQGIPKVIEKVINDQTNASLSDENILYNYQSHFRVNHSAALFLSFLTDKVLKRFDKGLLSEMILIDLQKTFDTIDHDILLQKLKAIRFSKGSMELFRFYLSERINFLNIFQAVKSTLLSYADDSCILFQHKKVDVIEKQLLADLEY